MIQLKVISPQREVLSTEASLIELPGGMGRFEILKDHVVGVDSLGCVFDHKEIVILRDGQDGIHITCHTSVVNRYDDTSARSDEAF